MIDEGKYLHLWLKYAAVINVLMKKTENEAQKLQLYKHEFEHCSTKQKTNFTFSVDLVNGKATNITSTTAIAKDLWTVLDSLPTTREWMKERKVKVTMNKTFDLQFEKI